MKAIIPRSFAVAFLVVVVATLSACGGGSKILKEPVAIDLQQAVSAAGDENIAVTLDWVIVKDGPGTWAKNAWWDEYLLTVHNLSGEPMTISSVQVVDSLDTTLGTLADRKQLVAASKDSAKRYKDYGVKVKPGAGTGTMVAAGTGIMVAGSAMAMASLGSSLASAFAGAGTATSSSAIASVGAAAFVVAVPVLIVGGVVKGANNKRVGEEIVNRQTVLPLELAAGDTQPIDLFFPVAPSPGSVQLVYETADGPGIINLDTADVLSGLHFKTAPQPETVEEGVDNE